MVHDPPAHRTIMIAFRSYSFVGSGVSIAL